MHLCKCTTYFYNNDFIHLIYILEMSGGGKKDKFISFWCSSEKDGGLKQLTLFL